jgi:uracil-DNA glycosylase family 4
MESLEALIKLSGGLDFKSQKVLRSYEDEIANVIMFPIVNRIDTSMRNAHRYLLLTSLPFVLDHEPSKDITELWNGRRCTACKSVVKRTAMPTGNVNPKFIIVGDAPGVGLGEKQDFDRVFTYGPSSIMLRRALSKAGIYESCWFTNLIKCSTQDNRPSFISEVMSCIGFLKNEMKVLGCDNLIVLGEHASHTLSTMYINHKHVQHPSYYVRKGKSYKEYAEHVEERLML